ncbi:MAG: dephospho-CoA kinase [Rhodospirillales bacterium]|nr:dephospho-CoA kinase [Rhodospirillales bacterium]
MFVLGLTGSIGMGKSTVAAMFARRGAQVHDADTAVHRLYGPGGAAVPVVAAMFPDAIVGSGRNARIDRVKLGAAALGDKAALAALEAAVHPLVGAARDRFLRWACRRGTRLVIVDVPLLFETGGERNVDATCVVSAPAFIQTHRVLRRPGMTADKLASIRRRQMPDAEKRRKADYIVPTGLSRGLTWRSVGIIARDLGTRHGQIWPPR